MGNGLLCILGMFHCGWLCEELLILLSEIYVDAMDVNHGNSAKKCPVPKVCFFVGVHREAIRLQKTNASTVPTEKLPQSE